MTHKEYSTKMQIARELMNVMDKIEMLYNNQQKGDYDLLVNTYNQLSIVTENWINKLKQASDEPKVEGLRLVVNND